MASQGKRLLGRRILITGAASGIGLATVRSFLVQGARVAALDRDAAALERLGRQADLVPIVADVTDDSAVDDAVAAAAAELGGIDGVVNAAGVAGATSLEHTQTRAWQFILEVNLTGAMRVTRAALPHLKRATGATIVNVASGIALRPLPGQGVYAASKAGLIAWTRVLAQELAPAIRVNATCPGSTDTPLMRANMPQGYDLTALTANYSLGRQGTADEQADAILFLTGPESTFITGVSLAIDGGRTFH